MKKLALVLGGGASKGYAHIGVIKALEKAGIKPDLIVGTSMGAMIGGLYACGRSGAELEEMASQFKSFGKFSLYSTLKKGHILNIKRIKNFIDNQFKNKTHDDTEIPFVAVATELNMGKEKDFQSGYLKDTILSSISVPCVFPLVELDGNVYCDGGLMNNLPEDVARKMLPDAVVLSINVIGDYAKQYEHRKLKLEETMLNFSTLMTSNVIKNRAIDADLRLTLTMPDVSQMDFSPSTIASTIKKGETAMKKQIKKLKELLDKEN